MKLNAEYVVYLDANAAQVTVEDQSDPTAAKHPDALDCFEIVTVADLLAAYVQSVVECKACPHAVHEAMLMIPEYRAAVPLDRAGESYCGLAFAKER